MSVAGILSSSLFNYISPGSQSKTQSSQDNTGQFQQKFQQLGQDLQSGSLSTAQADLAALQKLSTQASSTAPSQSSNSLTQNFNQLSQDLQSGNTSAARQDYTTIQQNLESQGSQMYHHGHHRISGTGAGETEASTTSQLLNQLGQALQSGNISAAQQAYSNVQQDFQQFAM